MFSLKLLSNLSCRHYQTLNLITINPHNVLANFDYFHQLNPNKFIWPVLKANAYGHGYQPITQILKSRQFKYFILDSYHEALIVQKLVNRQVLLIGPILPQNLSLLNFRQITLTLQDLITLKTLVNQKRPVNIHLKINTGMNRQGISLKKLPHFLKIIQTHPNIKLEGIYSHLADADNPNNNYTHKQLDQFIKALKIIKSYQFQPKYIHLAATAGSVKINHPDINTIRLGLGLYGYNPLNPQDQFFDKLNPLKPALNLNSTITQIHHLKTGQKISYNLTYTLKNDSYIGILPIGYFDGIDRRLSNLAYIKYKQQFFPIIGRICMNLIIINFGNTKPKLFDQVTIVSSQKTAKNSIAHLSHLCHTIPYDFLVGLNPCLRRQII